MESFWRCNVCNLSKVCNVCMYDMYVAKAWRHCEDSEEHPAVLLNHGPDP